MVNRAFQIITCDWLRSIAVDEVIIGVGVIDLEDTGAEFAVFKSGFADPFLTFGD